MNLKSIGKQIRTARLKKKFTQRNLAECVGLTPNYLSMLERGSHLPKLETLIHLANALNVSPSLFLSDVSPTEKPNIQSLVPLLEILSDDELTQIKDFILDLNH